MRNQEEIKDNVRRRYAGVASRARQTGARCCADTTAPITIGSDLYSSEQTQVLPVEALQASAGCGNPTALAGLQPGEIVLDLGSGGGIDVLLSARRVGPTGWAYGLDMTDEMLELARENQLKAGVGNVEFLKGEMENVPLPDDAVDVIISNCVVNLSVDKDRVLGEAYRVLRPGGRLAIADVVRFGEIPDHTRQDAKLWCSCIAGALSEDEYRQKLTAAGFAGVAVEILPGKEQPASESCCSAEPGWSVASAFVRAIKPIK